MTCRELAEFLMSYLEGELPMEQRRLFEEHLEECPDCVVYLATYRETIRLCKFACACADAMPYHVPHELVRAILCARALETC